MAGFGGGSDSGLPMGPADNFGHGQGGALRDSHRLPNEGLSRAKYAADTEKEVSGGKRPGLLERFKRWFSNRL